MMNFKPTEPVQVEHITLDPDGVPTSYWRNALYLSGERGFHSVMYASGTKETLNEQQKIRKYQSPDESK